MNLESRIADHLSATADTYPTPAVSFEVVRRRARRGTRTRRIVLGAVMVLAATGIGVALAASRDDRRPVVAGEGDAVVQAPPTGSPTAVVDPCAAHCAIVGVADGVVAFAREPDIARTTIYRSPDGTDWTRVGDDLAFAITTATSDAGRFVIAGRDDAGRVAVALSDDLADWSVHALPWAPSPEEQYRLTTVIGPGRPAVSGQTIALYTTDHVEPIAGAFGLDEDEVCGWGTSGVDSCDGRILTWARPPTVSNLVWRSVDGGETWESLAPPADLGLPVAATVVALDDQALILKWFDGDYLLDDSDTWIRLDLPAGCAAGEIGSPFVTTDAGELATSAICAGQITVLVSPDEGGSWEASPIRLLPSSGSTHVRLTAGDGAIALEIEQLPDVDDLVADPSLLVAEWSLWFSPDGRSWRPLAGPVRYQVNDGSYWVAAVEDDGVIVSEPGNTLRRLPVDDERAISPVHLLDRDTTLAGGALSLYPPSADLSVEPALLEGALSHPGACGARAEAGPPIVVLAEASTPPGNSTPGLPAGDDTVAVVGLWYRDVVLRPSGDSSSLRPYGPDGYPVDQPIPTRSEAEPVTADVLCLVDADTGAAIAELAGSIDLEVTLR